MLGLSGLIEIKVKEKNIKTNVPIQEVVSIEAQIICLVDRALDILQTIC